MSNRLEAQLLKAPAQAQCTWRDKLNYGWRLLATGFSFASFSVGGLALTLLVFPLLFLLPTKNGARRRAARRVISQSFAFFIGMMRRLGIMTIQVSGVERLRELKGALVLANHPTLIDVVAILSYMPHADCVVKSALWNSPFLGGVVRAAGYISNDDSEGLMHDCAASLSGGDSLVIFPEGTRTVPGQPLKLQRGAAHIALLSRAPIVPVVLSCTPSTLSKDKRWYQIPDQPFHITLDMREPLALEDLIGEEAASPLAARRLTQALQQYFTLELQQHELAQARH